MAGSALITAATILGIDASSPMPDVRRAYRRLLFACHPDRNPVETADIGAARVRQICLAFDVVRTIRGGGANELLERQLDRADVAVQCLLEELAGRNVRLAAPRAARLASPGARFAPSAEHRGARLDVAA